MTFDPFMTMSVPIPNNLRQLPVFFVPKDPDTFPIKVTALLPVYIEVDCVCWCVDLDTLAPSPCCTRKLVERMDLCCSCVISTPLA